MLADEVKELIQSSYRQLLQSNELTPRYGQRQMIAEIANTLSAADLEAEAPGPVCVVEAGTGTGKTLAYLLAAIPLAQAKNLKLVVATATVALQEQVAFKDIPEILQGSELEFDFVLAKGRSRYLCLAQLDNRLRPNDSLQAMLELYGEELGQEDEGDIGLYQEMLDALSEGEWQGDRDDWKTPLPDAVWKPLTVDNSQCLGARCSHFRQCYFYRARDALDKADVIVTNHDLLLSDLALGGGVILPEPEASLYVFDEAHHLPVKSNSHFANFARIRGTQLWLERVQDIFKRLVVEDFLDQAATGEIEVLKNQCNESLEQFWQVLEERLEQEEQLESYGNRSQLPFKLGRVPEEVQAISANLAILMQTLAGKLGGASDELGEIAEQAGELDAKEKAEQWFPVVGGMKKRAEAMSSLCGSFAEPDMQEQAPSARWLSINANDGDSDIGISVSPVLAASNLQESLWSRCAGAVLTSASLSALGRFDVLTMRAGLPEHTKYLSIPSPFDFANVASLHIPRLNCDPSDSDAHTRAILRALPQLLQTPVAALMLFSSRRQMQDVLMELPDELAGMVLCQDDYQKAQLLKFHKQRIDKGEDSLIFGLASFAEGVDLPGKYCTHVLIAKIPFTVPSDPIEMTLADWLEEQGTNPFTTLAVPDAAFRLLQASGRLLRNERDSGRITLFDERLVSKHYGKQILESLPPYRREIFTEQY